MISLSFMVGRDVMHFAVQEKEIFYKDRIFSEGIRCIPKDEQFIRKVINSRGRYPKKLITMFSLNENQQKEYDEAKTEEDLANIIIKDCKKKGMSLLRKEFKENNGKDEVKKDGDNA